MTDAQYLLRAKTPTGTFIFSEPSENDWLFYFEQTKEKTEDQNIVKEVEKTFGLEEILERLVGVEDVKDRAGKALTVDEFKAERPNLGRSVTIHMKTGFWTAWTDAMKMDAGKNGNAPSGT